MKQQGFLLSLITIISLSGIAMTQGGEEDSKTKIVKPRIQPYYIEMGEKLELECRYTDVDAGDASLTWFRSTVQESSQQLFEGTDEFFITSNVQGDVLVSTLRKTKVDLEDEGSYKCRKRDAVATKGYNMQVYVFDLFPVYPDGKDAYIAEVDQELEMQCQVEGEITGFQPMIWTGAKGPIVSDESKYKTNDMNNTLLIKKVEVDDITNYTCGFDIGEQKFSAEVRVESKPHVKEFSKSKNLVQGDPLTLNCDASGVPLPSVTWKKGEQAIVDDGRVSYEDSESGVVNATLRIQDLDFDDRDEYTCVAENIHGISNGTVLVRVKDKLAALWPFLGICAEVAILCIIIFIYERRRAKKMEEEEQQEEAGHLTNSNDHKGKDEIRHRK